ncbi:bud neck involved protein [Sporothrix curviconia]|uniref:Bud neck involved protein n=1 Tax=Sporothrix curviconia TaxID=1260050 RepID=A0ABP0CEY5_9PEZI
MLQTRPSSAGGMLPPQNQGPSPYVAAQQPRTSFYGGNNMGSAPVLYRSATAPIQPYAFTSTPSLHPANNWQQQQQQQPQYVPSSGIRSSTTAPQLPRMQSFDSATNLGRISRQPASGSTANLSTGNATVARYAGSRDDSMLPGQGVRRVSATPRPQSAAYLTASAPQLSFTQATPVRSSPERYRRPSGNSSQHQKQTPQPQASAMASGSGMASVGHLYASNGGSNSSLPDQQKMSSLRTQPRTLDARPNSFHDNMLNGKAADDIQLYRQSSEDAKRFRRRSMPSLNASEYTIAPVLTKPEEDHRQQPAPRSPVKDKLQPPVMNQRPVVIHSKAGSSESVASNRSGSRPSSTNRNNAALSGSTANPSHQIVANNSGRDTDKATDIPRLVNIPPRVSSDVTSRLASTLSFTGSPMDAASEGSDAGGSVVTAPPATNHNGNSASPAGSIKESNPRPIGVPSHLESPAMRHLSAINQKGGKLRSKTSKLRRAFSFGSAADFRKTDHVEETHDIAISHNKLQKEPTSQELYDAEQARIAQQQEEGGIGSSIYGAKIFTGSTDNLSISSTASSASIMIRKMGRGMKKSTRSLVGLFRPKSIVGVPAADAPVAATISTPNAEAAEATVSIVTVEAERERVNVNPDVHVKTGGGTGFPRLERNSIDASRISLTSDRLGSSGTDNSAAPRKSILEGDKERAEVLAAVRKGILKNTGASSPSRSPADSRNPPLELFNPPAISESPGSSAPSTPTDDIQGHKRIGSVAIGGEDYFVSALRLRNDSRSGSSTPQGSMKRSATFSPRIVFYDTWPSQEYDRRGEIATCNRLTPMLAQQIKEELNSFKMEMEVHENSKIYTHFF